MKYISTRGQVDPIDFQDAVLMGLADDGGLLIPASIPDVSEHIETWREMDYRDLAFHVMKEFIDDIPPADFRAIVNKAYADMNFEGGVAPTVEVGDLYICELWHGPTLAFKDVALQLLGNLFEYILSERGGELNILGATSGDTGSAAIYGVRGKARINIFIMHPDGRTSPIQARQMTTVLDDNVHNIAVDGSFDDCQALMKTLAGDLEFKRTYQLGAVNSVNWARVLAQIVYYFWASFRAGEQADKLDPKPVRFSVPTGNFGDILAGWYAMQMGAPISGLILATNENDILSRFFNTGEYSVAEVVKTLSPSMDIQVASNFERYLFYRLGSDHQKLREAMELFKQTARLTVPLNEDGMVDRRISAGRSTTEDVLTIIRKYYEEHDYVLDPHSACGVTVAEQMGLDGDTVVCLATAHPAKFPDAIKDATGKDGLATHPEIEKLMDLPTRCEKLPNDIEQVRQFIVNRLKGNRE
ncbi:MAG: threonine synthase [Phycisphaerae bacterium]